MAQPNNCPFEITPLVTSNLIRTPNLVNLNYTNQDFWSMKTRLINFTKETFGSQFNDFVESSIAIMLIENFAFVADTLSFKIDQTAPELFIDTVSQIENAFRLSKLVGFQPTPPVAGTALWTATIGNAINTDLVMPAPITLEVVLEGEGDTIELFPADSNNQPIFNQDIILPSGSLVNSSIVGVEGRTRTQSFVSNGAPNQTLSLGFFPVLFDSIRVEVDGIKWNNVDFFTDSQPRSEFRVEFNSTYQGFVIFGNGTAGRTVSPGSIINVTYRTGGGPRGNIVTGALERQRTFDIPGFDFALPVTFRNYTAGKGGYSGDGIPEIQRKLPAYIRTQDRAVTGLDYKTVAELFVTPFSGQIGKVVAVLRNYGCSGNIIDLFILAKSGDQGLEEATSDLKVQLAEEIEDHKMLTDFICIRDGVVVFVDVSIDVILDKFFRKFEDEIKDKIIRKINSFFNLPNWEYGKLLKDTDIIKILADIKEVTSFEIHFVTGDPNNSGTIVTTKFFEIIRPDNIEITFIYE